MHNTRTGMQCDMHTQHALECTSASSFFGMTSSINDGGPLIQVQWAELVSITDAKYTPLLKSVFLPSTAAPLYTNSVTTHYEQRRRQQRQLRTRTHDDDDVAHVAFRRRNPRREGEQRASQVVCLADSFIQRSH